MWCAKRFLRPARQFAGRRLYRVTVVGGASQLGQTASLLLRCEPRVSRLSLHDTLPLAGRVALDLSHIPACASVRAYTGEDTLVHALSDADLVLATAGPHETRGLTTRDPLKENTAFIKMFASQIAKVSPMPFIGIATEPLNIMVPLAAEMIKSKGAGDYNPKKLFGISGVDALRAQAIYAAVHKIDPKLCTVPVICGHSPHTTVPLLTQAQPFYDMDARQIREITGRVRKADQIIAETKHGSSPSLSIAASILSFTQNIIQALNGENPMVNAFVENNDFGTSYFAGRMIVSREGAGEMERFCDISEFECDLLEYSICQLREEVMNGKRIVERE